MIDIYSMPCFKSIRAHLVLNALLPAILMALALTLFYSHALVREMEHSQRIKGNGLAERLATASRLYLANNQPDLLLKMTKETLNNPAILEIRIVSDDGRELIHLSKAPPNPGRNHHLTFSAPFSSIDEQEKSPSGRVQVIFSAVESWGRQKKILINSLGILSLGLCLSYLLARWLSKRLIAPIQSLHSAILEISKGNLMARANFQATGELQSVRDGFNAMADKLANSQTHLEDQIYQATLRLQRALRDLEDRHHELERARALAEERDRQKTQFLAKVSHEIRTPMNGIIGLSEELLKTPLSERQYEHLQLIYRSSRELLHIINEILDSTQVESGNICFQPAAMAVRSCLEDCIALLGIQSSQIRLILLIDSNVPDEIVSDRKRIRQIMTNLVGNALKFTRSGWVIVRVHWSRQYRNLLITVSDTGCGIAANLQARVFDPFFSLNQSEVDGTGLGLNITKQLVNKMGGQIGCGSVPQKGTTFWFTLPVARWQRHLSPSFCRLGLIDIVPISCHAIANQLKSLGAEVEMVSPSVTNSARPEHPWDAIVYVFPEQTPSFENIKQLLDELEQRFRVPVILAGPHHCTQYEAHYRTLGAAGFIAIPCRSEYWRKQLENLKKIPNRPRISVPNSRPTSSKHQGRILVVDDNEINRKVIKAQLEKSQISISEAADGTQAMELADQTAFDLILLDLQMPDFNGFEVLSHLRKHRDNPNFSTPVIAVTAHASPEQVEKLKSSEFQDVLLKPVFSEQLNRVLKNWLMPRPAELPIPTQPEQTEDPASEIVARLVERLQGDAELGQTILEKLLSELPPQLQAIESAIDQRDYASAKAITHKVHGSAAFCDLSTLKTLAAKLEDTLAQPQEKQVHEAWHAFERESQRLLHYGPRIREIFSQR